MERTHGHPKALFFNSPCLDGGACISHLRLLPSLCEAADSDTVLKGLGFLGQREEVISWERVDTRLPPGCYQLSGQQGKQVLATPAWPSNSVSLDGFGTSTSPKVLLPRKEEVSAGVITSLLTCPSLGYHSVGLRLIFCYLLVIG